MNITIVAGTRPNFIKVSPIFRELDNYIEKGFNIHYRFVHTGQHYDQLMSLNFFLQLKLPLPDASFNCGGGSHAEQTGSIMIAFEKELIENPTDLVIVVGDVNSTIACALVAKKMNLLVAHVEAGIRSKDLTMPEEINRMATDAISDYFFTTSEFANDNLINMGIDKNRIYFVGNTMIDTLYYFLPQIKKPYIFKSLSLISNNYFLLTLHRPSNVDDLNALILILKEVSYACREYTVVFPVHPRTKNKLKDVNDIKFENLLLIDPLSYFEFIYFLQNSKAIITDSGGITEEATVLNIPCLTMRDTTERPETVIQGTNILIGNDIVKLQSSIQSILDRNWKTSKIPLLWDGNTSKRIVKILIDKHLEDLTNQSKYAQAI
jgi:UDP-N-acetylglucosamine 2-epimerase (non-hydrolysing)